MSTEIGIGISIENSFQRERLLQQWAKYWGESLGLFSIYNLQKLFPTEIIQERQLSALLLL